MTLTVLDAFEALRRYEGLSAKVLLRQIDLLFRISYHFRREIELHAAIDVDGCFPRPPHLLPVYLQEIINACLKCDSFTGIRLWDVFKDVIWCLPEDSQLTLSCDELEQVDLNARRLSTEHDDNRNLKLAARILYPPVRQCIQCKAPFCHTHLSRYSVKVFSLQNGGYSALSSSFICRKCNTRYYPNYYLHNKIRHYYDDLTLIKYIQIEERAYVEADLAEFFTYLHLFAWVSAGNAAEIYNHGLGSRSTPSIRFSADDSRVLVSEEQVSRAFILNALIRDHAERGRPMLLSDNGDQDQRLKQAMETRNQRMVMEGQAERLHACDVCEIWIKDDQQGYNGLRVLRAQTTDGISIGRPCCKVHNCTTPLSNHRAHFCNDHQLNQNNCVIVGCMAKATTGHQTCESTEHRNIEIHRKERKKAFFMLKSRLKNQGLTRNQVDDAASDEDVPDMPKSDEGNVKPRARFERRKTHNEQLMVACCGVITGRATMFGAEAISGVKDFIKSLYPLPELLLSVIFYDNNCQLRAHLNASHDYYFKDTIMPVDVFHFKSKHSITDTYCQQHCNPALYPELADQDGNWIFNSSVAEQVNAWLGRYQAIVRDMLPYRYDFFLDEMIKRRNIFLVKRLELAGKVPFYIPEIEDGEVGDLK